MTKINAGQWGLRSQIEAAVKDLQDAQGNKDGIWNNEDKAPNTTGNFFERQPLFAKLRSALETGFSTRDEIAMLQDFRSEKEEQWGQPVTSLDLSKMKNGDLFAAQKAIALERLDRTPAEVTEGFVTASGKVDGESIESREIFWQRFRPTTEPSGKMIVLSPGFQETGRNFYEQIQKMNALGHDVVVMDHQWSGESEGRAGGLDRGFGASRDVAAVAAHANQMLQQEYGQHPDKELVLFGNSMGAGPGVLGAVTMNDNGLMELDGPPMPKGVRTILQSPFLGSTPNATNKLLEVASHLPILNRLAVPAAGLPVLTHDKVGAQKGAQGAVSDDVRAQLRTMSAAGEDLERIQSLIADGQGPTGHITVVHGDNDPLADPAKAKWLATTLGEQVTLQMIDSDNHVFEQNPGEQDVVIGLMQRMFGR
jgi:alpha-beta hydrolase superfamily lysophospholipase